MCEMHYYVDPENIHSERPIISILFPSNHLNSINTLSNMTSTSKNAVDFDLQPLIDSYAILHTFYFYAGTCNIINLASSIMNSPDCYKIYL